MMRGICTGERGFPLRLVALCLAVGLLQSCGPMPAQPGANPTGPVANLNFTVNGVNYGRNEPAAMAARQENFDKQVAALKPDADPIKGRALIVLPDHDRLRPLVAQTAANALKRPVIGPALEALVDETQQNLRELADSIDKESAFQHVDIQEQNDVLNPAGNGVDFVIWYQVRTVLPNNTGLWVGAWLIRRNGSTAVQGAAADAGTAAGAPRLASFVKSVRTAALRLGGSSVGGATAASLPTPAGTPITTTGSGIVIDKDGTILTNAHVVSACSDPKVIDTSSESYPAQVLTKDEANDLALVKARHRWPQAATFRDDGELRPGETVIVTGFPLAGLVASSMSVTVGTVSATAGPRDDSRLFQLSAPVQPGNSGGPALDSDGHVIGVVTSQLNGLLLAVVAGISPQNVNFAIKAAIVRNFLASQNVDFAHAPSTQDLPAADVGAIARRFTVRLQCGG